MAESRDLELMKGSLEVQKKYEFFLVGLTGAILSFSVQFSKTTSTRLDWLLVAGWALMLVSLVAGISRLSWHHPLIEMQRAIAGKERSLERLQEAAVTGRPIVNADDLARLEAEDITKIEDDLLTTVKRWEAQLKGETWWFGARYQVQIWTFYLGLLLYAIYRVVSLLFQMEIASPQGV